MYRLCLCLIEVLLYILLNAGLSDMIYICVKQENMRLSHDLHPVFLELITFQPYLHVGSNVRMTCTSWLLYLCSIIFATTYGTAFFPSSSASGESNSRVCPVDSDMSGLISSTALDFQEMMRKERALVLKNQGEKAVADLAGRDASSRMRCALLC